MKKTFKQFLCEVDISDLDIFKNNKDDPNRKAHADIIKQELEAEHIYDQYLAFDVDRVMRHSNGQYKSFVEIWNTMVRSKRDNTIKSFLQSIHSDHELYRNLAEIYGTYTALVRKNGGNFSRYVEEYHKEVGRMITMYKNIVNYRERYL